MQKKFGYEKHMISFLEKIEELEKKQVCKLLSTEKCDEKLEEMHRNSTHPSNKERIKKLLKRIVPKLLLSKTPEGLTKFRKMVFKLRKAYKKDQNSIVEKK